MIYVIILHYASSQEQQEYSMQLTLKCIQSVLNNTYRNIKIILIDNSETPNDLSAKTEQFAQVTFIKTDKNAGFASGCNIGIKKAMENGADYIFLLNNDAVADEFVFEELLKSSQGKENGVLGCKIYQDDGRGLLSYAGGKIEWLQGKTTHIGESRADCEEYNIPGETDFAEGCAFFIKREVLEKIGLLDEKYFLYLEDADFCIRAKKEGFKTKYVPTAKIWHKVSTTLKKENPLSIYNYNRNRLIFMRKHASKMNFAIFFVIYIIGMLKRLFMALKEKNKDKFTATINAFRNGLATPLVYNNMEDLK